MSRINATYSNGQINWMFTQLQSPFTQTYYRGAGITFTYFEHGASSVVSIDYITAPISGTSTGATDSVPYSTPGTYTCYGYARDASQGLYWRSDNSVQIIIPNTPVKPRPQNWVWWNSFITGQPFNVWANEWNSFCDRINAFRDYRGLSAAYMPSVSTGGHPLASDFNYASTAISQMGSAASTVYSGQNMTPSQFNGIRDALNAVV